MKSLLLFFFFRYLAGCGIWIRALMQKSPHRKRTIDALHLVESSSLNSVDKALLPNKAAVVSFRHEMEKQRIEKGFEFAIIGINKK